MYKTMGDTVNGILKEQGPGGFYVSNPWPLAHMSKRQHTLRTCIAAETMA